MKKRNHRFINGAGRILVVKMSSLGDLFHALPVVHLVRKTTGATIDWVVQPEYEELVHAFVDVDEVITYPRKGGIKSLWGFIRRLRSTKYTMVLDMQGLMKSAWVARAARSERVIGPSFQREGARIMYDVVAGPRNRERHAVDENLDMLRFLSLPTGPVEFPVEFPEMPVQNKGPRIALVFKSRWPSKNWPVGSFSQLAKRLVAELDAFLYLAGSEDQKSEAQTIADAVGRHVENLCGHTSIVQLGGYLKKMDLVITVDSGPMHIASAVGTPVLALFGPTNPLRTGPYGKGNRVLSVYKECSPCRYRECPEGRASCMEHISVDEVFEAAGQMLQKNEKSTTGQKTR